MIENKQADRRQKIEEYTSTLISAVRESIRKSKQRETGK